MKKYFIILASLYGFLHAQTVGLLLNDTFKSFKGYTLFSPLSHTTTYLINNEGQKVHSWESSYTPGNSVYLLENGNLLRTGRVNSTSFNGGGKGGIIQEFDWNGNLVWEYNYCTTNYCQHHDIKRMPNGNILIISWEYKSQTEAINAGRNPSLVNSQGLWSEKIIEVQPTGTSGGTIVWEWHAWDHLIQDYNSSKSNYGTVADHPELIDLNFSNVYPDMFHINSVDYNPVLDQIVLSVHNYDEIWIIDHSTTTAQAAGHTGGNSGKGGDLLYRWGNPAAYRHGSTANQKLYGQHDAQWIKSGLPGQNNILIFNNGTTRMYSSVEEITPPVDINGHYSYTTGVPFAPTSPTWSYSASPTPTSFYASFISGAHRLPNGNTLICDGPKGTFFEVTSLGEVVWKYVNPVISTGPVLQGTVLTSNQNSVFRCYRYAEDYSAFSGKDLTPSGPIEIYSSALYGHSYIGFFESYPNPASSAITLSFSLLHSETITLKILDLNGREINTLINQKKEPGDYSVSYDISGLSNGIYVCYLQAGNIIHQKKIVVLK